MNIRPAPWSWIAIVMLVGVLAKGPYRAFVRDNELSDFGFANVSPSFFFIAFLVFVVSRWTTNPAALAGLLGAAIGTELVQFNVIGRTFDVWDLVAGIAGWSAGIGLLRFGSRSTSPVSENAAEQSIPADRAKARSG